MRTTTRQRTNHALPLRTTARQFGQRLLFASRIALAASTVVVTYAVLTQEPARPEARWLLAFLATSLFVVAVVESEFVRRMSGRNSEDLGDFGSRRSDARGDAVTKISQLMKHRADYVHTVSHELRTPLTSIRGFAELLAKDEELSATAGKYADTIVQESDRLARIVDDIIQLTRMENGLLELRHDAISTADLLREAVSSLSLQHGPDRVRLELPSSLPWVRGDRRRLGQVIRTLLLEAVSHAAADDPIVVEGSAREEAVTIRLAYPATSEHTSTMAHTLEGLWQCSDNGLATRLGNGELGLYVSKNVVEAHGGRVSVEHDSGRASVIIELPR